MIFFNQNYFDYLLNVSTAIGSLHQEFVFCLSSPTLGVIKKQLEADTKLKLQTNVNVDDIMELLKLIITTTYFSFRGNIYQQKFGTAMGSPVSPVIANLFMEWLEQQVILTAPITCKPKLWKRCVDGVMEVVKKGCEQELTEHLNSVDTTGSIKFTYEEESDNSLPFLDTYDTKGRWNSESPTVSEENAHRPIFKLHVSPSITPETGGHQNVIG